MLNPDQCWKAVCARDAGKDGEFVFAVSSTGIYCRPSCPARRPRREHVNFYADGPLAEAAGYRPCKRCAPHGQSPAQHMDALVIAACELLVQQPLTLDQLASKIGLSASHLSRAFKARTGLTPRAWADAKRRERLEQALPSAPSVLEAALAAGYSDTRALYQANAALGLGIRRKHVAGETLRYAIAPCELGLVLMACSGKGLCAVLFADSDSALEQELQQRFATAQLERDEQGLKDWLSTLLGQITEPQRAAHLPLDIRGSAFQQRIWSALREIPSGQTRTYAQLAAEVGSHPRAVARACASNPLGLIVPCHRVIASGGGLAGYRWGLQRKQQLLTQERHAAEVGLSLPDQTRTP